MDPLDFNARKLGYQALEDLRPTNPAQLIFGRMQMNAFEAQTILARERKAKLVLAPPSCASTSRPPLKKTDWKRLYRSKSWELTTKIHLRVIGIGLPVQIALSSGEANDAPMAEWLLADLPKGAHGLADKGYDAHRISELIEDQDCTPHIPPRRHRCDGITYSKKRYKQRNLIERCFNKLKQFRHIAMRFDRNPLNYLAMIKLASTSLWLRLYESAA